MIKQFETAFDYGEEVYIVTDLETPRTVTGFLNRPSQTVYIVRNGTDEESFHLDIELVRVEKPKKIKGFKAE